MRKHFLILMLMALLPLAGWAQGQQQQSVDISQATFTIGLVSYNYTAATPVVAATAAPNTMVPTVVPAGATDALVWGTDYTLVYYNANKTLIEDADVATQVKNVGTYYVAAKGKGNYSGTTAMVEFQILPAELTITISAVIEKQYGNESKPNVTFKWNSSNASENNVTFSGWLTGDETEANKNTIVNSLTFAWTDALKTANANGAYNGATWNWYGTNATSGYTLAFSATAISNSYTYKFVHEGLRVTPVPLSVASGTKFTYAADYTKVVPATATTAASGGYLYSGVAQVPNYTITYKDPQNHDKSLTEKKGTATTGDYTVSYQWCATYNGSYQNDANGNVWAGFYKPTITAVEKGNYSGSVAFPAKFDGNTTYYQIRKKDLKINIMDKSKVYNGEAFGDDDIEYNPLGLVSADATADVTTLYADANAAAFTYTPAPAFAATAKTYKATPSVTVDKLKDAIKNNYNVTAGNAGFLTIQKRPVTVTAKDLEREMEEDDPELDALDLDDADYNNYANYVTIQANGTDVGLANAIYGFSSFSAETGGNAYGTGKAEVLEKTNEYAIVKVLTNVAANANVTNAADFIGKKYKVATTATSTTRAQLLGDGTGNNYTTETSIWVNVTEITSSDNEKKDVLKAVSLDLDYTYAGAKTYEDAIKVTIDNSKSTNYTVTGVDADFKVKGYRVSIYAVDNNKTYGQSVEELTYGTSGLIGSFAEGSEIKYIIKKNNGNALDDTDYNNGRLKANTYQIVLDTENSVVNLPADYDGYDIDTTPATLTIGKKTVYAIPAAVTLSVGNTITDLNTLGKSSVRFLDSNAQNAQNQYTGSDAIEEGDEISYMLVFSAGGVTTDANGKITAFDNTPANNTIVVKEVLPTGTPTPAVPEAEQPYYVENNANANYTINVTTTALVTNGEGVLTLNRTDAKLLAKLAAANGKKFTVRFAGYTDTQKLLAGKWYSVVLPFEYSVAKLSAAMKPVSTTADLNPAGYAIVNVINETKTEVNNVHFKLEMNNIPANTPFLVKPATDVVLNFKDAGTAGTAQAGDNFVQFENVTIVAPEDNVVKTVNGVDFTGVYKHTLLANGASLYAGAYYTADGSQTMDAFASYWIAAPGARVFVEDLDANGTTVIREVSTETMSAIAADGWYTLNGVKLQGVPTEKGIYINNGKKVVIK